MSPDDDRSSVRVDRWLWSVRLAKTRSAATTACKGGEVRIGGQSVKASTSVRVGDRIEIRTGQTPKVVEVLRLLDTRVGAPIAMACYLDHSPPMPVGGISPPEVFHRDRGAGRPTKKDRRQLDRLRTRRD